MHWLHLPETLLVSGTMATELGLDGEFCLESSTAEANATPIFRRSSRPCAESVVIDGLLWLEYQAPDGVEHATKHTIQKRLETSWPSVSLGYFPMIVAGIFSFFPH